MVAKGKHIHSREGFLEDTFKLKKLEDDNEMPCSTIATALALKNV